MNRLRAIAVGALATVLVLAVTSVVLPGLVAWIAPESLVPPPDAREAAAAAILPVVAVVALIAAAYVARSAAPRGSTGPMVGRPVETGASDAVDVSGRRFRHARDWAATQWATPGTTSKAGEIEGRLRQAAIHAYANETGVDLETARQTVEEGVWTDDAVAAWFVAGACGFPPGTWWLRERLRPEQSYRTYVDRSAAAIDDLRSGGS